MAVVKLSGGKPGTISLERLGPVVAYRLVKQRQRNPSLNLLWALAAGLKGTDWRELTEVTKKRLRRETDE